MTLGQGHVTGVSGAPPPAPVLTRDVRPSPPPHLPLAPARATALFPSVRRKVSTKTAWQRGM